MTYTHIKGNTFAVKDQLKALGAKWDADAKAWKVPDTKAAEAHRLVASAPKQEAQHTGFCLKCKGRVKAPYLVCYACKTGEKAGSASREMCAECGDRPGVRVCRDSSGISAMCCSLCAALRSYERSFA